MEGLKEAWDSLCGESDKGILTKGNNRYKLKRPVQIWWGSGPCTQKDLYKNRTKGGWLDHMTL